MRAAAGLAAISASALACAGVEPAAVPACDPAALRPPPEASCELDAEVVDFKRDTVMTVWSYVGSDLPRLPLVLVFDARARVESVCAEGRSRGSGKARAGLERAIRALRAMPPAPRCLAGTRLDLSEDFAEATSRWRRQSWQRREPEELCLPLQQRCVGWREPVCGLRSDGSRRTYADACEACRDPSVEGYDEGVCPIQ
jgi:hypothetical protein